MGDQHGGKRKGAGRKKGSKNKTTIAREVIGEIIDAPDPMKLVSAIHQRGHAMLLELERIVLDPTQPIAARIMAARTALPFMLPKLPEPKSELNDPNDLATSLKAVCLTPCKGDTRDRYRRLLAVCYVGPFNINEQMVTDGWALAYRKYSKDYVRAETFAKSPREGLWRSEFVLPWEWRRR